MWWFLQAASYSLVLSGAKLPQNCQNYLPAWGKGENFGYRWRTSWISWAHCLVTQNKLSEQSFYTKKSIHQGTSHLISLEKGKVNTWSIQQPWKLEPLTSVFRFQKYGFLSNAFFLIWISLIFGHHQSFSCYILGWWEGRLSCRICRSLYLVGSYFGSQGCCMLEVLSFLQVSPTVRSPMHKYHSSKWHTLFSMITSSSIMCCLIVSLTTWTLKMSSFLIGVQWIPFFFQQYKLNTHAGFKVMSSLPSFWEQWHGNARPACCLLASLLAGSANLVAFLKEYSCAVWIIFFFQFLRPQTIFLLQ